LYHNTAKSKAADKKILIFEKMIIFKRIGNTFVLQGTTASLDF